MAGGKHRAPNPHRNRVGSVVAAGAVPLVLAIVGSGSANAAPAQPNLATFLDSVGMERSRSDRIAGQTIGTAAMGAVAGASAAAPFALTSGLVGGVLGLAVGLPFVPVGIVAGPVLGATMGAAVITAP